MTVERFLTGEIQTNTYLVVNDEDKEALLIDPGSANDELDKAVLGVLEQNRIVYILLTHGHFDHIGGVAHYQKMTGAKVVCEVQDEEFVKNDAFNLSTLFWCGNWEKFSIDIALKDGDTLPFGKKTIKLLHTPGHTQGSCCYLLGDALFSGDTLMCSSIGRTDFATGDVGQMKESLEKLKSICEDYTVYPGHGGMTTLQQEKDKNPYMGNVSYDDLY